MLLEGESEAVYRDWWGGGEAGGLEDSSEGLGRLAEDGGVKWRKDQPQ